MPPDVGTTGWNAILPPRQAYSALEGKQEADYLIIGAGFAGLAAARRLVQLEPDARIIILEGRNIAEGSAGRNSGFMIDLPHELASDDYAGASAESDRRQTAMNRAAIEFVKQTVAEYGLSGEALAATGKTNAAATEKGLKHNADYAKHLSRLGEAYRMLDTADIRSLTGTDYYLGGLWTPGTAMLQPALFVRGVTVGLQRHASLNVYEQSPVVSLERVTTSIGVSSVNDLGSKVVNNGAGKRVWQATTPQGSVRATKVILAVNGLVEHFGFYSGRLMHLLLYGSMTRALSTDEIRQLGGEAWWGLTPADPLGTTVRRIAGTGGERLIIRNRVTYDPGLTATKGRMASVARSHQQSFNDRFPMLKNVTMEHCWSGRLCLSLNSVPAWGEVDEGLFSACCQNGLGATKGTAGGIIAAEQAVGSGLSLMPDYVPDAAPKRLMPEPFMWLGANAVMRWKEHRAGREF